MVFHVLHQNQPSPVTFPVSLPPPHKSAPSVLTHSPLIIQKKTFPNRFDS